MSPKSLMTLGAFVAAVSVAISFVFIAGPFTIMAFAGGALFGKGYGIWEERQRVKEGREE